MAEKPKDFQISDESVDILAGKIHQLEFVDLEEKMKVYRCCQCGHVAIKHCIANCEDVFCYECYGQYYGKTCPVCGTVITESIHNHDFLKTVLSLKVSCEFKKNGCPTVISLGEFLGHIEECKFHPEKLLPNIYKVDPGAEIEKINTILEVMQKVMQDLQTENRQLKEAMVEIIKDEIEKQMTTVTNDLQNQLTAINTDLANTRDKMKEDNASQMTTVANYLKTQLTTIKEDLARDKMEDINASQMTTVTNDITVDASIREYKIETIRRSIVGSHQEQQDKLYANAINTEQLTAETKHMQFRVGQIEIHNKNQMLEETQPRDLHKEVNSGDCLFTAFNWTITGIRKKIYKNKKVGDTLDESDKFSIPSHKLKFSAKLWRRYESRIGITLKFTTKSSAVSLPFLHSRKYVLVDQSNSGGKQDVVWLDQPFFGQNSVEDMTSDYFWNCYFFPIKLLSESDKYMMNDTIFIRIILEPIALMLQRVSSMDGTLLLRIDNYTERKREEDEGIRTFLTSESFYTSDKRHRMEVEIHLNNYVSNGKKGISIYPMFRIGEWDDSRSIPIKFKYTRVLMDQSDAPTKRDIRHEPGVQECQRNRDFQKIKDCIPHEVVEKPPYLKDDSLLIKFAVEIVQPKAVQKTFRK